MVAIKCSHEFYERYAGNHINDFIKAKCTHQPSDIYFSKINVELRTDAQLTALRTKAHSQPQKRHSESSSGIYLTALPCTCGPQACCRRITSRLAE